MTSLFLNNKDFKVLQTVLNIVPLNGALNALITYARPDFDEGQIGGQFLTSMHAFFVSLCDIDCKLKLAIFYLYIVQMPLCAPKKA